MKDQLARPIRLLALVGLLAFVVGFADTGTAWAQGPGMEYGKYEFKHGKKWDNSQVGYVCNGTLSSDMRDMDRAQDKTETLYIPNEQGDPTWVGYKVTVTTTNTNEGAFGFWPDTSIPQESATVGAEGRVAFKCTSSRNGVALLPFFVQVDDPSGNFVDAFFVRVGVGFVLNGNIPGRLGGADLPYTVRVGGANPLQNSGSAFIQYVGTWLETTPDRDQTDLLSQHEVTTRIKGRAQYVADAYETSYAMGDEVGVRGTCEVGSSLPLPPRDLGTFRTHPNTVVLGLKAIAVAEKPIPPQGITFHARLVRRWETNTIDFMNTWADESLAFTPRVDATAKNGAVASIVDGGTEESGERLYIMPWYPFR